MSLFGDDDKDGYWQDDVLGSIGGIAGGIIGGGAGLVLGGPAGGAVGAGVGGKAGSDVGNYVGDTAIAIDNWIYDQIGFEGF
jgi:hypothetical protein